MFSPRNQQRWPLHGTSPSLREALRLSHLIRFRCRDEAGTATDFVGALLQQKWKRSPSFDVEMWTHQRLFSDSGSPCAVILISELMHPHLKHTAVFVVYIHIVRPYYRDEEEEVGAIHTALFKLAVQHLIVKSKCGLVKNIEILICGFFVSSSFLRLSWFSVLSSACA